MSHESSSDSIVDRKTPVLFATDGGIHLRHTLPKQTETANAKATTSTSLGTSAVRLADYSIGFCDLSARPPSLTAQQVMDIGLTPKMADNSRNRSRVRLPTVVREKAVRFDVDNLQGQRKYR